MEKVNLQEILFSAAKLGDAGKVEEILTSEGGKDLNLDKALGFAIKNNNFETSKLLIRFGADLYYNREILRGHHLYKASSGKLEIATFLLENYTFDEEALDTSLLQASRCGCPKIVGLLLSKGANPRQFNHAALMRAIEEGEKEIVKILLGNGADINYTNTIAYTIDSGTVKQYINPLCCSIEQDNVELAKVILKRGADVNVFDFRPLSLAIQSGSVEMVKLLLGYGATLPSVSNEELKAAAEKSHLELLKLWHKARKFSSISETDFFWQKKWIKRTRNLGLQNEFLQLEDDWTTDEALFGAIALGFTKSFKTLVQFGADFQKGELLVRAVEGGLIEIIEFLLEMGVDVHYSEDLPLREAVRYYQGENVEDKIVKLLLERGADPNAADGFTLTRAAQRCALPLLRLLLRSGGNPSKISDYLLSKTVDLKFLLQEKNSKIKSIDDSRRRNFSSEKKKFLEKSLRQIFFSIKIVQARMYYRPNGPGYFEAISAD